MTKVSKNIKNRWPYGDIMSVIAFLEEKKQPWAIARYQIRARFVDDEGTYMYELIIFQTYNADSGSGLMTIDKPVFREIAEKYGLKRAYNSRWGDVYAKDHSLRNAVRKYNREHDRLVKEYKDTCEKRYILTDRISREYDEQKKADLLREREGIREEEAVKLAAVKRFEKEFPKENNIIIFVF